MYNMLKVCARLSRVDRAIIHSTSACRPARHRHPIPTTAQHRQYCSTLHTQSSPSPTSPINFDQLIGDRRSQAGRSILVQVNSDKSYPELHRYCSQYGRIDSAHHYTHDEMHYIVIEYADAAAARAAVLASTHNDECDAGSVVCSPFLWFRAGPKAKLTAATTGADNEVRIDPNPAAGDLTIVDGNRATDSTTLHSVLSQSADVDTQMRQLHRLTGLNDVGTRLRFIAARQIEQSLHGMFPHATAHPFGSSVNGFGRLGCDLDLILRLGCDERPADPQARLVYHTKEHLSNGRSQTQRQMESISDMLHLFLPGVCHVRRILQARVPIIKYRHDHLDLEVDLSMSNLSGLYMSELFYMFGQLDDRVQPLVFTVRRWAQSVGLTNASPGRWISNFSLTCLVIFYLQQIPNNPILPSINTLITNARRPQDVRLTGDAINCTFLRDLSDVRDLMTPQKPAADADGSPSPTLAELLAGFFEFYSQMNFAERAISLNEARTVTKPDHAAIYIVNPLEVLLNVSKNVSTEECERFRIEVRNAAWALDSFPDASTGNEWGVLSIVRSATGGGGLAAQQQQSVIRPSMFYRSRMVDVSDLFGNGNGSGSDSDEQKVVSKQLKNEVDVMRAESSTDKKNGGLMNRFKNDTVRGMVEKIQRKGRSDMQQLESQMKTTTTSTSSTGKGTLPTRARKR